MIFSAFSPFSSIVGASGIQAEENGQSIAVADEDLQSDAVENIEDTNSDYYFMINGEKLAMEEDGASGYYDRYRVIVPEDVKDLSGLQINRIYDGQGQVSILNQNYKTILESGTGTADIGSLLFPGRDNMILVHVGTYSQPGDYNYYQWCWFDVASYVSVDSIELSDTELNMKSGESHQLTANVKPENANNSEVTWTSNNEKVATVDGAGNVTAITEGKATITAKAENKTATCSVNVKPAGETPSGDYTMEITDETFSFNPYETYYWVSNYNYTYKGGVVTFKDNETITVDGTDYALKNKKTEVKINQNGQNFEISMSNLALPIEGISGQWAHGSSALVYKTDIPGQEEVRTSKNMTEPIQLSNVPAGIYHLTEGSIYDAANKWSPGIDLNGDGKKETEGYFGVLPDITITVNEGGYVGVATDARVYDDFQNDIWLQYQQKEMKVGDKAEIYPWRTEQIVTDTINNDVFRPNFNFEIIQGEDVVTLNTNKSDQKAEVTAKNAGTAIVKVTYDAVDYKGQHWNGISAVNTGYAVFTVGEDGVASIDSSIADWRHYDTIYYTNSQTTPYTFTVNTKDAASVKVTCNGMEVKGEGNAYTANLENRSNIIGIVTTDKNGKTKSMYRVIDARYITVNIANQTNPGKEIKAGDRANISFSGITMPVYKLATIYNPQWGAGAARVTYNNDALGAFEGVCGQWDLATKNSFDVTFDQAGDYTFTSEKGIFLGWWGQELGYDTNHQGQGQPGIGSPEYTGTFSFLPDFTVSVGKGANVPAEEITLDKNEATMEIGETLQLNAAVTPENTSDKVTWSSSDESIATVNSEGWVTGIKSGQAVITAAAGEKEATCKVTIIEGSTAPEFSVSPDEILPGTEVTVNFTDLKVPVTDKDPVHTMQTKYKTDIPGLAQIASEEAKSQEDLIKTLTFTIPENTEPGTYHLTDGCVYKEWGGTLVQGIIWMGKESQEFYKGQMPDIKIVVGDPDAELKAEAQKVTDQINALGEITLDKEDAVKAARSAYDALDKKAKAYITEETLSILADAEMKIKDLKPVIGQVTVSVERFTIGQGYYKEPVNVALKEGNTCSDIIRSLIGSDNYIGQPNYLSAIKGADLGADKVDVPEYISKYFNGPTTEEALLIGNSDENLGEFDYSQGSGWYYFVNNKAPSVGMNDRIPEDGDVIRLQFTLAYGNDLKGNESYIIANKDGLTKALADFNGREDKEALLTDKAVQTAYDNAVAAAQNMGLSQNDTDMAVAALNSAVIAIADREAAQNVEDMITALPSADKLTLVDKEAVEAARAAYNGLTETQRGYISDDVLKLLETAEAQIASLEDNTTPEPTPEPTPTPEPGTNPNGGNGSNGSGSDANTSTGVISDSAAAVWASIAFIVVAAGLTGAVVIRRRGKSE